MSPASASSASPKPAKSRRRAVRWQRRVGRLFGALVLLAVVIYFGLGAVVALQMTRPKRHYEPERSPASQQLAFTDVRFPARGGDAEIAGWYIPHESGRHVLVIVHGKDSSRTREHSGRTAELMARLYRRGFAVLAIDLRGHGQSSDARLSFGRNENRDILGAVDWLRAQGYPPGSIGVLGVSLGGASTIFAAAQEPAIGAAVSDCSYADVAPIIQSNFVRATHLPALILTPARLFTRLFEGYDLMDARPVAEVGKIAPRPLLIIHGEADQLIPIAHAYALHAAYPQSELWTLPGIRHAAAFVRGPDAYVEHVATFFDKNLKP